MRTLEGRCQRHGGEGKAKRSGKVKLTDFVSDEIKFYVKGWYKNGSQDFNLDSGVFGVLYQSKE